METVKAKYSTKCTTGSRLEMTTEALPLELNQMIVWVMHHEADAMYLLPEYNRIRQQAEERDEGSAKNHGLEV